MNEAAMGFPVGGDGKRKNERSGEVMEEEGQHDESFRSWSTTRLTRASHRLHFPKFIMIHCELLPSVIR